MVVAINKCDKHNKNLVSCTIISHTHTHTHTCIHICIHTHTHTYIHTHIHIYAHGLYTHLFSQIIIDTSKARTAESGSSVRGARWRGAGS